MGLEKDSTITPFSNVVPEGIDVYRVNAMPKIDSGKAPSTSSNQSAKTKKHLSLRKKFKQEKASKLPFPLYEPCKEPVDLAQLLDEIATTIRRFVILDGDQADAAALWVAHTYLVELFDASPLAIINAPERACAKTLFQTVLSSMSYHSLSASNVTASPLFRSVELWMPTLFFDEADTFFKDNHDLQGMINAGYKQGGFVLRSEAVGDTFMPRKFSVFSAKSIAGIALEKHLPDSMMSRGIVFNMRRKLPDETVTRLRYSEPGLFEGIASKLERIAEDYAEAVNQARPALPDELSDRGQDNWEPLLAIASCASATWQARAISAALKLSRVSNESVSTGNELLADIQQVFEQRAGKEQYADKISSSDLIAALQEIEESPWATYNHGHPISPRQLAKQLCVYGIKSKTVRVGKYDTPKGYELEQFTDAFARYLANQERVNDLPESESGRAECNDDAESNGGSPNLTAARDMLADFEYEDVADSAGASPAGADPSHPHKIY